MMLRDIDSSGDAFRLVWDGEWSARALRRVRALGFPSVTAFVESEPLASLFALAQRLNATDTDDDPHANAAIQIVGLWREEARQQGSHALERMARSLLLRQLREKLPEGWRSDWTEDETARAAGSRCDSALAFWVNHLTDESGDPPGTHGPRRPHRHELEAAADAVCRELLALRPPAGWVPSSIDDPILAAAFRNWKPSTHPPR